MLDKKLALGCIRAIESGESCAIGRERNYVSKFQQLSNASCAGKSIRELVWDELMTVYQALQMGLDDCGGNPDNFPTDAERNWHYERKGQALGLAMALAIFQNPYNPDVDLIRKQASERFNGES